MPTDTAAEVARMAGAFGLVASAAVPVGLVGWLTRRPLPAVRRPPAWSGADVLVLFLFHFILGSLAVVGLSSFGWFRTVYGSEFPALGAQHPSAEVLGSMVGGAAASDFTSRWADANAVRALWGSAVSVPVLLAAATGLWVVRNGRWPTALAPTVPGHVAAGVAAWLVLTPVVHGINLAATKLMEAYGTPPEEHPFTNIALSGRPGTTAVFAVVACVLAPLAEELLFRGLLIGWSVRWRVIPGVVLGCWLFIALASGSDPSVLSDGRLSFWLSIVIGLYALTRRRRPPARTAAAVFASAAAFGLAHPWWPTPVPLFAFGLGLGALYVRTGSLVAPVIAHGLFNAVSFVYLLRGGTGGM